MRAGLERSGISLTTGAAAYMAKKKLTEETKEEIEGLIRSLKKHNFYTILGVNHHASKEELRRAYFALSKDFHPDTYFGEDIGYFRGHLEALFRSITRAYEILSNPTKRRKYDLYLQQKNDLRGMESSATKNLTEVRDRIRKMTGVMPAISMGSLRREQESAAPARKTTPSVPPPKDKPFDSSILDRTADRHAKWRRRRLKSLLSIQQVRVQQEKVSMEAGRKIQELLRSSEEAEKEENYLGAMNALKVAIHYDADNQELQGRFRVILEKLSPVLAQKHYSMGLNEEEFGDREAAVESFRKAVEYEPQNAEYIFALSRALFESEGDLHEAYDLIKKAIACSPDEPLYHLVLGMICLKAGMPRNAAAAFETCLEQDPGNVEARRLLRKIR
jgi:curved DNA-binding protein CbpA